MPTFTADMRLQNQEAFGPKTNSKNVTLLHPDMCVNTDQKGNSRTYLLGNRAATRSTWLPGKLGASNLVLKDNESVDDQSESQSSYRKFEYGKMWDDDADPTTPEVVNNSLLPDSTGTGDILEVT